MADEQKPTAPVPAKDWRTMNAKELLAYIEAVDKAHRKYMTQLRAVHRALLAETAR